ncbi:MAG: transposase [Bacteroidia bacterium]
MDVRYVQCAITVKPKRIIQENHRLNELREEAKELLMSAQGVKHRKKRCIETEAVFGQLKSNNNLTRFTFFGKNKVRKEL